MTDAHPAESLLTYWEGLVDAPEQVWRWVATPAYLVAETPWQVLKIEPQDWDQCFGRLLAEQLGVPQGWSLAWEPGACVVSRIAFVGPSLDALLLEGFVSRWAVDYLTAQIERGYSVAFRGGGRSCRWLARALGAQWPLAYETRGRGLALDPRLLVWEGEVLPQAADVTIVAYDELERVKAHGAPLIVDQVGSRVPRSVSVVVDVRRDGRVLRIQERRGRDWNTLFRNAFVDDVEALEPIRPPSDSEFWRAHGGADWWSSLEEGVGPLESEVSEPNVSDVAARAESIRSAASSSHVELSTVEPMVEALPASPILTDNATQVDEGWEVEASTEDGTDVMTGDDAVLEASLGLGPPPAPAGQSVQRDPALAALLSAIRKDIDG